jgi:hypothetical protein
MRRFGSIFAALLVCGLGCSKSDLVPVAGTVLLDDQPLANARVSLVPQDGAGVPAQAMTDGEGRFTIATHAQGDGAAAGEYRVVITKLEATYGRPLPTSDDAMETLVKGQQEKAKHGLPVAKSLVPVIYTDAARTPLRLTAPADGPVTLQLSSALRTPAP